MNSQIRGPVIFVREDSKIGAYLPEGHPDTPWMKRVLDKFMVYANTRTSTGQLPDFDQMNAKLTRLMNSRGAG